MWYAFWLLSLLFIVGVMILYALYRENMEKKGAGGAIKKMTTIQPSSLRLLKMWTSSKRPSLPSKKKVVALLKKESTSKEQVKDKNKAGQSFQFLSRLRNESAVQNNERKAAGKKEDSGTSGPAKRVDPEKRAGYAKPISKTKSSVAPVKKGIGRKKSENKKKKGDIKK